MTVDVQAVPVFIKYWRHFGFQTYAHTTKYEQPLPATYPFLWSSCTITQESVGARAIDVNVTCAFSGLVSVAYGYHSGQYGMSTPPQAVQAAVPATIRLTDLIPGKLYYCCPRWSGTLPNPSSGGLPLSGSFQFGEMTQSAR